MPVIRFSALAIFIVQCASLCPGSFIMLRDDYSRVKFYLIWWVGWFCALCCYRKKTWATLLTTVVKKITHTSCFTWDACRRMTVICVRAKILNCTPQKYYRKNKNDLYRTCINHLLLVVFIYSIVSFQSPRVFFICITLDNSHYIFDFTRVIFLKVLR